MPSLPLPAHFEPPTPVIGEYLALEDTRSATIPKMAATTAPPLENSTCTSPGRSLLTPSFHLANAGKCDRSCPHQLGISPDRLFLPSHFSTSTKTCRRYNDTISELVSSHNIACSLEYKLTSPLAGRRCVSNSQQRAVYNSIQHTISSTSQEHAYTRHTRRINTARSYPASVKCLQEPQTSLLSGTVYTSRVGQYQHASEIYLKHNAGYLRLLRHRPSLAVSCTARRTVDLGTALEFLHQLPSLPSSSG